MFKCAHDRNLQYCSTSHHQSVQQQQLSDGDGTRTSIIVSSAIVAPRQGCAYHRFLHRAMYWRCRSRVSATRPFTLCKPPKNVCARPFFSLCILESYVIFFSSCWPTPFVHNWFSTCTWGFFGAKFCGLKKGLCIYSASIGFFEAPRKFSKSTCTNAFSVCTNRNFLPFYPV